MKLKEKNYNLYFRHLMVGQFGGVDITYSFFKFTSQYILNTSFNTNTVTFLANGHQPLIKERERGAVFQSLTMSFILNNENEPSAFCFPRRAEGNCARLFV